MNFIFFFIAYFAFCNVKSQECPSSFACPQETCTKVDGTGPGGDTCLFQCPGQKYTGRNYISAGQRLNRGEGIISSNKQYGAFMQTDNNFCIYKLNSVGGYIGGSLWCSYSHNGDATGYMTYQTDNNICVYTSGQTGARWCTMSHNPNETPGKLFMQDDGNLCAYEGNDPTSPAVIWCSGTAQGLIPIIGMPDPLGTYTTTIEISYTFMIIVAGLLVLNMICMGVYFIKRRKEAGGGKYNKVVSMADSDME